MSIDELWWVEIFIHLPWKTPRWHSITQIANAHTVRWKTLPTWPFCRRAWKQASHPRDEEKKATNHRAVCCRSWFQLETKAKGMGHDCFRIYHLWREADFNKSSLEDFVGAYVCMLQNITTFDSLIPPAGFAKSHEYHGLQLCERSIEAIDAGHRFGGPPSKCGKWHLSGRHPKRKLVF